MQEIEGSRRRNHELEEKIILLSAEINRLRSGETEHEGTKKKLLEYERK